MEQWVLWAAWVGICLGALMGAGMGLFFRREGWLGGYAAHARRMLRLGHIAFFGTAFLNLAYALSAPRIGPGPLMDAAAVLLLVGSATMPVVCFLTAWRDRMGVLFPVPALSLIAAAAIVCIRALPVAGGGPS